jgi:DNA-binding IclR family transcriptional regulator
MVLLPKTANTIVDKAILFKEIKKAKARQFAMSEEEYLPGLITISAPLFDPLTGKGVGAVCFDFSVLQHSANDVKTKYAGMIRETARKLSELLPPDKTRRQ